MHLREGGEGFDFLGFQHRLVRSRNPRSRHVTFLARWPSREAMQRARDRIRELTLRKRLRDPVEEVVQDINRYLRGWGGYFRVSSPFGGERDPRIGGKRLLRAGLGSP